MKSYRRLASVIIVVAATLLGSAAVPAQAEPTWAPDDTAAIHPGAETVSEVGQCTANFVFYDETDIYIGSAAHCTGGGAATDTNGCEAESLPLGTPVEVDGATRPATLAYSSWLAMQESGETDSDACNYNDFALLRLHPDDHGSVNPSVPFWGGPEGTGSTAPFGSFVYAHGNSSLRLGLEPLQPKVGTSLGDGPGGWTHLIYLATPGIPGDSGGAVLDDEGNALGVFSTIVLAPYTGANYASDVGKAVTYMESHGGPDVTLASGTTPFSPLL